MPSEETIAVVGLGYVGLPVAIHLGRAYPGLVGFDIDEGRIAELRSCFDRCRSVDNAELERASVQFTADPAEIAGRSFYIVTVPTPVDRDNRPDLRPVIAASETVGRALVPGSVVCFESTVYPGVTEEICGPALERASGLVRGRDFKLAYSPERINPGDPDHTFETIVKVVAAEDEETLSRVAVVYSSGVKAGIHPAPSILVAETAKVLENTQRDLNIALMNELACICERLGIPTRDVLAAAKTKWNFLPFRPGLVGGHCIGVDPYYLATRAQQVGLHPEVILAGRRINDRMGEFVANKLVRMLIAAGKPRLSAVRVAILGVAFKENVPDHRNSRVPDIVRSLRQFGIEPLVHDPLVDAGQVKLEYGLDLCGDNELKDLDAIILAAPHRDYLDTNLWDRLARPGAIVDVTSALVRDSVPEGVSYWSL